MSKDKHPLQTWLENCGYDVHPYSGRGMYGQKCIAVTTSESEFKVIANLVEWVRDNGNIYSDIDHLTECISNTKTDSMGRGVVLYWPIVSYWDYNRI